MRYDYNFTISCSIYYYHGSKAKECNEFVTETIFNETVSDHPYVGKFIPTDNIKLNQQGYDDEGPFYVFLQVNVIDPTFDIAKFNDSAQKSYYRLDAYGSGKSK